MQICGIRDPEDNSRDKDRLEYYIWLAKLADKGKITSIFFADGYGLMSTYQGKPDATFRGGSMVAYLDPVVLISAMAAVTKSVAFGVTSSTSYICVSPSLHFHFLQVFFVLFFIGMVC